MGKSGVWSHFDLPVGARADARWAGHCIRVRTMVLGDTCRLAGELLAKKTGFACRGRWLDDLQKRRAQWAATHHPRPRRGGRQYMYVLLWCASICRALGSEQGRGMKPSSKNDCKRRRTIALSSLWPKLPREATILPFPSGTWGPWIYFLTLGSRNKICPGLSFCPSDFQASRRDRNLHPWRIQQACVQGSSVAYVPCPGPLAARPGLLSTREAGGTPRLPPSGPQVPSPSFWQAQVPCFDGQDKLVLECLGLHCTAPLGSALSSMTYWRIECGSE